MVDTAAAVSLFREFHIMLQPGRLADIGLKRELSSERLRCNARALIATAEAAMAAKAADTTEDAWPRMLDRWRAAATDLRGGNQVPEANPESCRLNSKLSEPQQRVEEAYQALRGSGWPV